MNSFLTFDSRDLMHFISSDVVHISNHQQLSIQRNSNSNLVVKYSIHKGGRTASEIAEKVVL